MFKIMQNNKARQGRISFVFVYFFHFLSTHLLFAPGLVFDRRNAWRSLRDANNYFKQYKLYLSLNQLANVAKT